MRLILPEKPPLQELRDDQWHIPEISDDQVCRIGRVIVEWSKLEAALDDTIWLILDINDDDGKILTKKQSADAKIQLIRAIAPLHIKDEAIQARLKADLNIIDELKECRNFVAHGVWGTIMPEETPIALSLKPKAPVGVIVAESFPSDRMDAIVAGIQTMKQRLINLPEQLGKPRRVPREQPRP